MAILQIHLLDLMVYTFENQID